MFQSLVSSNSEFRSFLEHSSKKIESIDIELLVIFLIEIKVTSPILGQNIAVSCTFKYGFIEKQVMENNADREDVTDSLTFERHVFDVDDFRGNKARSSTPDKKILFFISVSGKSKVTDCNFQRIFFSEHDILGFEVSVNYPFRGQMTDPCEKTSHNGFGLI